MAFDAGSVFVRLGGQLDRRGFEEFDKEVVRAQKVKDIEARLGGDVQVRDFDLYERKLKEAHDRASRKDAFKATLGANFDSRAFNAYERELKKADTGHRTLARSSDDLVRSTGRVRTAFGSVWAGGGTGLAAIAGAYELTAGIKSVVSSTTEFDRSMRNVNSIAQLSENQLKSLSKQVLSLAGQTAQAPKTLADGLYDLVSSGFSAKDSMTVLRASANAATAGLTDTATSTKAVAAVLNAYHEPAAKASQVSDTLFQTVNRGVISFEELSSTIGDVLPFASSLHINLNEVGSAVSTMTKEGINGFETMTRLKNLMQSFIKPSDGMAQAIEATGAASGEALIQQKGFQGALEAVIKTTDGSKEAAAKLFPNIRALSGAFALTGNNAKSAHQDLQGFADVSGATSKALSQQAQSISYQWNKVKAEFSAVAIEIGEHATPIIVGGLKAIGGLLSGGSGTGGLGTAFTTVKQVATAAFGAISTVISDSADNFRSIGQAVSSLWQPVKRTVGNIVDAFQRAFGGGSGSGIGQNLRQIIKVLVDIGDAVLTKFYIPIVKRMLPGIEAAFKSLIQIVKGVVEIIAGILTLNFGKVWSGVVDIVGGALKAVGAVIRTATAPIRQAFSMIWEGMQGAVSAVWDGITSVIKKGLDFVLGGVTSVMGAISDVVDVASKIPVVGGKFKGLADDIDHAKHSIDQYRESLRATNAEHGRTRNIEKMRGDVVDLKVKLSGLTQGTDEYRQTAQQLRDKQGDLNQAMAAAKDAAKKGAQGISGIGSSANNASDAVAGAAEDIASNVNSLAKSLGAKSITFHVARTKRAQRTQSNVFGGTLPDTGGLLGAGKAGGGWIGAPGEMGPDDIPIVVGRGEAVLNRHQQAVIEGMLGGGFLDSLFANVQRPHYMASGGRAGGAMARMMSRLPRFAGGGQLQLPASFSPTHQTAGLPGYPAIDDFAPPGTVVLSPVAGTIARFSGRPPSAGAYEGPHGPFGWSIYINGENGRSYYLTHLGSRTVRVGQHVSRGQPIGTVGDYPGGTPDHIHEGVHGGLTGISPGSGSGFSAAPAPTIAGFKVAGPAGQLKDIATSAIGKMRDAANNKLASIFGVMSPGGDPDALGGAPGDAGALAHAGRHAFSFRELERLWVAAGGPPSAAHVMARIAIAESGGQPWVINSIGATGLWQIYNGNGAVAGATDPLTNAQMAVAKYRAGGLGPWVSSRGLWSSGISDQDLVRHYGHAGFGRGGKLMRALRRFAKGGKVWGIKGNAPSTGGAVFGIKGALPPSVTGQRIGSTEPTAFPTTIGAPPVYTGLIGGGAVATNTRTVPQFADPSQFTYKPYSNELARIDVLEKQYGLAEHVYNSDDSELVDEDTGFIDETALKRRVEELNVMIRLRYTIEQAWEQAQIYAQRAVATLRNVIRRLTASLKWAKKKDRSGIRAQLSGYQEALTTWATNARDAGFTAQDMMLTVGDLEKERNAIDPTARSQSAGILAQADQGDLGNLDDFGNEVQLPPTPEQIAAAAAEQFESFKSGAAQTFSSFGANFMQSAQVAAGPGALSPSQLAAGVRYFGGGASGTSEGGTVLTAGGQTTVVQNVTFTGPQPADPHTFTQATLHELRAAV